MDKEFKAILPDKREVSAERSGERYYGTHSVPPSVAFEHGIPLKGADRRLLEHVEGNDDSAFRGTTLWPLVNPLMGQGAILWAKEGGWVYHVGPMMGWDPARLLEGRVSTMGMFTGAPNAMEGEISVPSKIEASLIIKGASVREIDDKLVLSEWNYNPNYRNPR